MASPSTTTEVTERSTLNAEHPMNFCVAAQNLLLVTNGINRPRRWNGMETTFDTAGVSPPATGCVITPDGSAPAGVVTGTYTAYVRFLDGNGNPSDLSPVSASVSLTAKSVVYTSVPVPTESKVTRRQILRNTDGQTTTYYVDVDTTDLVLTTFTTNVSDATLATNEAVVLLDSDGSPLANIYAIPPNNKAVFISHLSRVFGAVEVEYKSGHVQVTNGSATVTGVNTQWVEEFEGRYIYIVGADQPYLIDTVNEAAQTITLSENYGGDTEYIAIYAIRSEAGEERTLVYTEAGVPEGWPLGNSLSINYTGDEITGLISKSSWIYVLESRHVHKVAYQEDPATDGTIALMAYRGCVNQRCWQSVDNVIYMLDGQGIWAFDGQGSAEPISMKIQEIFRPDFAGVKVNWKEKRWFHSSHDPAEETLRWYVVIQGNVYPSSAICYQYRQQRWWIEDYPVHISASTQAKVKGTSESVRTLLGGDYARFYLNGFKHFDAVVPLGTMNGTLTSATQVTLTDSIADFNSGIEGSTVYIVSGKGVGQSRVIVDSSATELIVRDPFLIVPDSTSKYQIGGIPWKYRTGPFSWTTGEAWQDRNFEINFDPTVGAVDLKLYPNRDTHPTNMEITLLQQQDGVSIVADQPEISFDLSKSNGHNWFRLGGNGEYYQDEDRKVSISLSGVGRGEQVKIHSISVGGATNNG